MNYFVILITILIVIGVIVYVQTNKKNINFSEIFKSVKTEEIKKVDDVTATFDEISGIKDKINASGIGKAV